MLGLTAPKSADTLPEFCFFFFFSIRGKEKVLLERRHVRAFVTTLFLPQLR